MAKPKVGRNDLCPCGSGKKYKKCCGMLDDLIDLNDDSFTRNSKLLTLAKTKLDSYYESPIKKIRKDAQKQFLRFALNESLPEEHEAIFSDWLWFDLLTEDDNTLSYCYLLENANYVPTSLRDCLSALSLSFLSVYEVEEIQGSYLKVRNIFLNNACDVLLKEPWEGLDGKTDLLLLGRLVFVQGENVFSGMVAAIENKEEEKEFLLEHMNFIRGLYNDTMLNMLKFHGEILYGLFDYAHNKTLVNFDDMRSLEIEAGEHEKLLNALNANPDFAVVHNSGGASWFEPVYEHYGYIRLVLTPEHLVCCADVLDDILKLQAKVAAMLPGKELQIISNLFLQKPPAPDKSALWFQIVKDKETERWLDSALAELEGKTPRECLGQENGKAKLLEILDNFAAGRENAPEHELIDYMRERVKN